MKIVYRGRPADAAAELIVRSTLGRTIDERGGRISLGEHNAYEVSLPDDVVLSLSTGERMLWNVLLSIAGEVEHWDQVTDLLQLADRLDDPSKTAVVAAIARLFGVRVEAGASS